MKSAFRSPPLPNTLGKTAEIPARPLTAACREVVLCTWELPGLPLFWLLIYGSIYIYAHVHIHIYIYICVCVHMAVSINLGVQFLGLLATRTLPFWSLYWGPSFLETPSETPLRACSGLSCLPCFGPKRRIYRLRGSFMRGSCCNFSESWNPQTFVPPRVYLAWRRESR